MALDWWELTLSLTKAELNQVHHVIRSTSAVAGVFFFISSTQSGFLIFLLSERRQIKKTFLISDPIPSPQRIIINFARHSSFKYRVGVVLHASTNGSIPPANSHIAPFAIQHVVAPSPVSSPDRLNWDGVMMSRRIACGASYCYRRYRSLS